MNANPGGEVEAAIDVDGLVKRYKGLVAVDGISFTVRRGETFGLLGPNGAGKTTTLEVIEGLRRPDAGRILVQGIDVGRDPRRARHLIGVQLQEAGFFEKLTVAETIRTFGKFHKKRVPEQELIARFNLEEKANAFVETLSGGQRQRLSIALAMVNDPAIVFLDEPTTGLDPQARRNLWDTIRAIQAEGRTVVLTTHYMDEAEELCDRIAIVDRGRLIALDTPRRLIESTVPGLKVHLRPHNEADAPSLAQGISGLPAVDRVVIEESGEVTIHTQDFETMIVALVQSGPGGRDAYHSMRVEAANLEDVFLQLTGRQLRE